MERYLRFLLRVGKRYLLWKKTTNVPACPTAAEWEEHLAATKCARCEKAFVEGCPRSGKVLHAPPPTERAYRQREFQLQGFSIRVARS